MVLFPLAVLWLVAVAVWLIRNNRNAAPEERTWRRWTPRPRTPRDGDGAGQRGRARRASATRR